MKKWSLTGCLLKHFDFEIKMDDLKGKPYVYTSVYELRLSLSVVCTCYKSLSGDYFWDVTHFK